MCGTDNWDVYLVKQGNEIQASYVYQLEEKDGKRHIVRSLLTQNSGLWVKYASNQNIVARQKYEEKIVDEVCEFIESLGISSFDQQFSYDYQNFMPFFWHRFGCQVKYTYVIEDTSDMEKIREGYIAKLRGHLKKAQANLKCREINDLKEFYRVNKLTFDRQEIEIPYTYEQFESLYNACKERDACRLLAAVDNEDRVQSVAMLVWDGNTVYYLLNGTDPEFKQFQGNLFLIDKSIEVAHDLGLKFDFEGSVIRAVNHCFREFAGTPMPYFRLTKDFEQQWNSET